MSRGAPVWKFSPSPGIQDAVLNSRAKLSLSGIGLIWGQGKFGPQCWFIFAGTRTFLGTTRHLLVFQVFGTASVGEVQYQGISSLWRWLQSSLRGLFTSKERPPCVNVITVWEYKRIGRWLFCRTSERHTGGGWSDLLHEESKSCFILFWLDKYLWVHYEVTPTDMGLGDSRSLFSSFSSFPRCSPSSLPTLTPRPPSAEFLISKCAVWQG